MNIDGWYKYEHALSNPSVIEFLRFGFPIGFDRTFLPPPADKNHESADNHPTHIDSYLQTELEHGALLGLLNFPPLNTQWSAPS